MFYTGRLILPLNSLDYATQNGKNKLLRGMYQAKWKCYRSFSCLCWSFPENKTVSTANAMPAREHTWDMTLLGRFMQLSLFRSGYLTQCSDLMLILVTDRLPGTTRKNELLKLFAISVILETLLEQTDTFQFFENIFLAKESCVLIIVKINAGIFCWFFFFLGEDAFLIRNYSFIKTLEITLCYHVSFTSAYPRNLLLFTVFSRIRTIAKSEWKNELWWFLSLTVPLSIFLKGYGMRWYSQTPQRKGEETVCIEGGGINLLTGVIRPDKCLSPLSFLDKKNLSSS